MRSPASVFRSVPITAILVGLSGIPPVPGFSGGSFAAELAADPAPPGRPAGAPAESALPRTFRWTATPPLVLPGTADGEAWHSAKDPTIVRHEGRWHLFTTVRGAKRSHAIQHLSFEDWKDAERAERRILACHSGFFCAPQVFWFRPHGKWYLVCQASEKAWTPEYQPAWSRTDDIADVRSWSKLAPLFGRNPEGVSAWLDFWVICDEAKAHLFFTSLDGRMWRSETRLGDFPGGWSKPVVALQGDIFEASHTYRLKGSVGGSVGGSVKSSVKSSVGGSVGDSLGGSVQGRIGDTVEGGPKVGLEGEDRYLTIIEAQGGHGWRYYKAYVADRLDGEWKPLARGKDDAFASMRNVAQPSGRWTDSVSHGELIRAGADERLEVDPKDLRLLFQGVLDAERQGKNYGEIPWKLGILEPAR